MSTPKETFQLATLGGRIPIGVAGGIAWLESAWDPSERTGRHVGLYQLVDKDTGSIYGDWLAQGGPRVADLSNPDQNAGIGAWGIEQTANALRKILRKYGITLPDTVFWPLVYWAWLAGTSDVPKVIASYAKWVSRDRRGSLIPLKRAWEELDTRFTNEGQLWLKYQSFQTDERWLPERIRQALVAGAIAPKLTADFVRDMKKAKYAGRLAGWVKLGWEDMVKRLGPEFEKRYGRPISSPWLRGVKTGAGLAILVMLYLLLRR